MFVKLPKNGSAGDTWVHAEQIDTMTRNLTAYNPYTLVRLRSGHTVETTLTPADVAGLVKITLSETPT